MAVLYLIVQTVESYFLTPFIQERMVSIPPALLLCVQLVFALLFGLLGLLLAAPVLALLITTQQFFRAQ